MKEPLVVHKVTEGHLPISRLQHVDLTPIKNILNNPEMERNLISINGGDYKTQLKLFIDNDGIDITIQRSYPFLFISGSGPVEHLIFSFDFKNSSSLRMINQRIDEIINSHLNDNQDSWLYSKIYSRIETQKLYNSIRAVDEILFKDSILLSKCLHIDSVYESPTRFYEIGKITANIILKPSLMVKITFGWIYIAITDKGVLIRSTRTKEEESEFRIVINKKYIESQDIQEAFINIYNKIYETNYTDVVDLMLVHDMMEI